jgi:PAS domain S-box-containing protein
LALPSRLSALARDLAIAIAVGGSAWLNTAALHVGPLPPFGLASGVALAAVLLAGPRALIAVGLGMSGARLLGGGGFTLITFAAGASIALQTAAEWWLLTRVLGFRQTLERGRDAGMLLFVALACAMLRTVFEMPMLVRAIAQPVAGRGFELFVFASVGYAMGVMLVTPPILAWAHQGLRRRGEWHAAETVAVTLLILATARWCFASGQDGGRIQIFGLIILPASMWLALRGPSAVAMTIPLVVAGMAAWGAAHGMGTFWRFLFPGTLKALQALGATIGVSTLLLATVESGRRRAIRELRDREGRLRASQEMFESFMRYSPAIAYIKDGDGRLLFVNPAFEQEFWPDGAPDWRGRFAPDLFDGDLAEFIRADDAAVRDAGGTLVTQVVKHLRGEEREWLSARFTVRGAQGETLLAGIALDVTERRRAEHQQRVLEQRMTEAQKLESLGLLAGGVAHDFNNSLTSILGYADLAHSSLPMDSPAREPLDHVVRGARNAADLTRQMLAYAGRGQVAMRALEVPALVSEMGHLLQVSISKRCALFYDFPERLAPVQADEAQLRQVVMNLILNASEALGEDGGTITLRAHERMVTEAELASPWSAERAVPGRYVVLEVRDDGAGMDKATLARIFDPFFTTKFQGRGLGLAAVLGIVRAHQGAIQVESAPGAGTTFRVLLPALAPIAAPVMAVAPSTAWHGEGLVLVIDDEASVRGLARAMLQRLGFGVVEAVNGQDGLAQCEAHASKLRLVLLDRTMPDMSGDEVLVRLQARYPSLPVVLSSGYSEAMTPGGSTLPPAGFLAKPYRLEELTRVVRAALEPVRA